ncbi:MAG: hypothetical protein KKH74_06395 [Gammaproteobacteria bacterium]|nr:hypothetical protein [Gammaproteobacteria bacterium]MBU1732273.1 hypothetical protein [Gammaproteobacteria bacterium]MBU1893843.1 hypothetical protein [Gammaproteobacteria bacterium]
MSAAVWGAIAVGASTAVSLYNGQQQSKAADNASRQAQANADRQAADAEQAMNRANQKKPDTSAILSAAQQSGKQGGSGTMLTGPQGVGQNDLALGKTTLLGM